MPSRTKIVATQEEDLAEVCDFLHEQLGRRFSPQIWRESLLQHWSAETPNLGTHLRHEGKVVGVLCAIYSDQEIDGKIEKVCNPHSWVVLEVNRSHSIGLLLTLIKQRGYHFTMFTPNPKVAKVFLGLRFRVLDDRLLFLPNLPRPWLRASDAIVECDRGRIAELLKGAAKRDFEAHAHLPWLKFVAFGRPGHMCLVIYKPMRWKKLRCASISHVSDPAIFAELGHLLQAHLLLANGFAFSKVEARWLVREPSLAIRSTRGMPKLVLSPTLGDAQVHDLYSELMALDL
jgi:hypothetical protein